MAPRFRKAYTGPRTTATTAPHRQWNRPCGPKRRGEIGHRGSQLRCCECPNATLTIYAHLFREPDHEATNAVNPALVGVGAP